MMILKKYTLYCVLALLSVNTYAVSSMQEDAQHVRVWNSFVDDLYELHQHNLKNVSVRTENETGGYAGKKSFYEETRFYNSDTGLLLSRVQREKVNSKNIHLIEVFVYNEQNEIVVDYLVAFLPEFRNAPIQTLISVHRYNDLLHAFRQFDASGALITEQCEGQLFNDKVFITLDEDEIINRNEIDISNSENNHYYSCFELLPKKVGKYLNPRHLIAEVITLSHDGLEKQLQKATESIKTGDSNKYAHSYLQRADIYFKLQKFSDAVTDYTLALKLDKSLDKAYFGRGMALGRLGLVQQGIDDLSVYLKRQPYDSHAYTKRGVRYIWLGDLLAAKKDLTEAVSLDVTNAEAHDDLGVVYTTSNNFAKAIYHFKQSIYYDQSYQKAYHNLSLAYVITENYSQALKQIDKSLLLQSNNRNSLLLKSTILEKMGKISEAESIRENAEFLPEGNWSEQFSLN